MKKTQKIKREFRSDIAKIYSNFLQYYKGRKISREHKHFQTYQGVLETWDNIFIHATSHEGEGSSLFELVEGLEKEIIFLEDKLKDIDPEMSQKLARYQNGLFAIKKRVAPPPEKKPVNSEQRKQRHMINKKNRRRNYKIKNIQKRITNLKKRISKFTPPKLRGNVEDANDLKFNQGQLCMLTNKYDGLRNLISQYQLDKSYCDKLSEVYQKFTVKLLEAQINYHVKNNGFEELLSIYFVVNELISRTYGRYHGDPQRRASVLDRLNNLKRKMIPYYEKYQKEIFEPNVLVSVKHKLSLFFYGSNYKKKGKKLSFNIIRPMLVEVSLYLQSPSPQIEMILLTQYRLGTGLYNFSKSSEKDEYGRSSLFYMIKAGFSTLLSEIQKSGVKFNEPDKIDSRLPLHFVMTQQNLGEKKLRLSKKKYQAIIRTLVAGTDKINHADKKKLEPLALAVKLGDLYAAKCILKHKDVNRSSKVGFEGLIEYAASKANFAMVNLLRENNVSEYCFVKSISVDLCDSIFGNNNPVELSESGIDIILEKKLKEIYPATPYKEIIFYKAVMEKKYEQVKYLLGCNIKPIAIEEYTMRNVLHLVVLSKHVALLKLLLPYIKSPSLVVNQKDKLDNTVFDYALRIKAPKPRTAILKALFSKVDSNAILRDFVGKPSQQFMRIQYLVCAGAKLLGCDKFTGDNVLHLAVRENYFKVIQLFILSNRKQSELLARAENNESKRPIDYTNSNSVIFKALKALSDPEPEKTQQSSTRANKN